MSIFHVLYNSALTVYDMQISTSYELLLYPLECIVR